MGRTIAESALVVTTIAGLLSWPLAPSQYVIGDSFNDPPSLAWTLQRAADRLAAGTQPWGHTQSVAWPDGGTLFPTDLLEAVLLTPVTWAWGGGSVSEPDHAAAPRAGDRWSGGSGFGHEVRARPGPRQAPCSWPWPLQSSRRRGTGTPT